MCRCAGRKAASSRSQPAANNSGGADVHETTRGISLLPHGRTVAGCSPPAPTATSDRAEREPSPPLPAAVMSTGDASMSGLKVLNPRS